MDNLKGTSSSQGMAFFDLVFTSIALLWTILPQILDFGTSSTFLSLQQQNGDLKNAGAFIYFVAIVLVPVILAINLWAAMMLLKATKQGGDQMDAVRRARIYRNINIALYVLSILCMFYLGGTVKIIVGIVFRGILIYVIYDFVQELDQLICIQGLCKLDNV